MGILELWLAILVSAIVVFFMSALIWTVLPWHKTDFNALNDEDAVRRALGGSAPGNYMTPYCTDHAELKNDAMAKKFEEGPVAYITVVPNGKPNMAPYMIKSFFYNLLVGVICAYMVTRTTVPDTPYLQVFRISGTTAFLAYGMAFIQESIWFGRPWSLTLKNLLDALLYALLTGGVFGWLYG